MLYRALCSVISQPRNQPQEHLPPHQPKETGAEGNHVRKEGFDLLLCPCQRIYLFIYFPLEKASSTHSLEITMTVACSPCRVLWGEGAKPWRISLCPCSSPPHVISPIITRFLLQPTLLKLRALILSLWRPPSD